VRLAAFFEGLDRLFGAMAATETSGSTWTAHENAIVVAEYFFMLAQERAGRPYVKADHWRRVMEQTGRTKGSVEFKLQNISAVLEYLGIPWVWGYPPARNYQEALVEAAELQLSQHREMLEASASRPPQPVPASIMVAAPALDAKDPLARKPAMRRLLGKYDPAERDQRNRSLGEAGEEFVLNFERHALERAGKPKLAEKVAWISRDRGDGYGYDILSFTPEGKERLLEVKTTYGHERTPFWITRRECDVAADNREIFRIRRVFHFGNAPRMFELQPPLEKHLSLDATCFVASFRK
jgi:hypothetical protein